MLVKNRIKKYPEFQKVIKEGKVKKTSFFVVHTLDNNFGYTRIGISVPRKTGNAVLRNRIKRQIRAAIAASTDYSKSIDLVLIVRKTYDVTNYICVKNDIQEILGN